MKWFIYLLESNIYLSVFYGFYRMLLYRETFHRLNRWYLLTAVAIAFLGPLVQVTNLRPLVTAVPQGKTVAPTRVGGSPHRSPESVSYQVQQEPAPQVTPVNGITKASAPLARLQFEKITFMLYLLVALFFLTGTFAGLYKIVRLYRRSPHYRQDGVIHVRLEKEQEVFSFFNWLFYHPGIEPEEMIIAHELVHIRQKHSVDVILFELLRAVCWANPLIHLMRRDVKLNHEYLADERASDDAPTRHDYALLLIDHSFPETRLRLVNTLFNPVQLKARINRLSRKPSGKLAKWKYLAVLPLLAAALLLSSFTGPKAYGLLTIYVGKGPDAKQPGGRKTRLLPRGKAVQTIAEHLFPVSVSIRFMPVGSPSLSPEDHSLSAILSGLLTSVTQERISAFNFLGKLGKEPQVMIDHKLYPSDILYSISNDCVRTVRYWVPGDTSLRKYGDSAKDGYVSIQTLFGRISTLTPTEKENILKLRAIGPDALYARVTLQNEQGEKYDRVLMKTDESFAFKVCNLPQGGKVAAIIEGKLYTEDNPDALTAALRSVKGLWPDVYESFSRTAILFPVRIDPGQFNAVLVFSKNKTSLVTMVERTPEIRSSAKTRDTLYYGAIMENHSGYEWLQGERNIDITPAAGKLAPGATLWDLLKRLDGFSISPDGRIRLDGRTVRSISLDDAGDFGLGSRNRLGASLVESVVPVDIIKGIRIWNYNPSGDVDLRLRLDPETHKVLQSRVVIVKAAKLDSTIKFK